MYCQYLPPCSPGSKSTEQRCPLKLERGLDFFLKWHFQHLKPWQLGGLAFPLESLPFLSMVSHHSPQPALLHADGSSGDVNARREPQCYKNNLIVSLLDFSHQCNHCCCPALFAKGEKQLAIRWYKKSQWINNVFNIRVFMCQIWELFFLLLNAGAPWPKWIN